MHERHDGNLEAINARTQQKRSAPDPPTRNLTKRVQIPEGFAVEDAEGLAVARRSIDAWTIVSLSVLRSANSRNARTNGPASLSLVTLPAPSRLRTDFLDVLSNTLSNSHNL